MNAQRTSLPPPRLSVAAVVLAALTILVTGSAAFGQSRAGSQTASELLVGGSELVAAGSLELLEGGATLVVTSATETGGKVRLVLEPVARGVSSGADLSRSITIEISSAAWESAKATGAWSARTGSAIAEELSAVVGETVEAVAILASAGVVAASATATLTASATAASAVVLGYTLHLDGVLIGWAPLPILSPLLGHRLHSSVPGGTAR